MVFPIIGLDFEVLWGQTIHRDIWKLDYRFRSVQLCSLRDSNESNLERNISRLDFGLFLSFVVKENLL